MDSAQDTVTRIEIRPPAYWRFLQWAGCVLMPILCVYIAALGVTVLTHIDQGFSTAMKIASDAWEVPVWELSMFFLALPFLFATAVFGLKRTRQPFGFLEIHPNGLLLACYSVGPVSLSGSGDWFPWGFADWSNLAPAGVSKIRGMRFLGLGLIDLEAFLASREKLKREDLARRTRLGPQWARITMSWMNLVPIGKYSEMIWAVRDVTAPKSSEEKDVLTWNRGNYGFHILVPSRDIPGGAQALVDMIEKARKATINRGTSFFEGIIQEHTHRENSLRDPKIRLDEIGELLNKGLITVEEYQRKRSEIISNI